MNYISITIPADERLQEQLIANLSDLNPAGFEQKDDLLIVYFEEAVFNEKDLAQVTGRCDYTIQPVKQQNWNEEWERNFSPVVVGDFCAVRADFHAPILTTEHEVIITPKMSFGTGHHATTCLMIEQMQHLHFENKKVFDFGTGTGILSILAEKLQASYIYAIDVDEWSIENATENAEKNSCNRIILELTSKVPAEKFDVILANINRNVLLQHADDLKQALSSNGKLLLSGLLTTDEEAVVSAYGSTLQLQKRTEKDDWISLLFTC